MDSFDVSSPLGPEFTAAIGGILADFLAEQRSLVEQIDQQLGALGEAAQLFTTGGKRIRPAGCVWGWVAVAGIPGDPAALLRAAASLDLLHVSALVHDDVMDASDTRRGIPAAHRRFAARHAEIAGRGEAESFGRAAAILLGDALLVWSEELFAHSGLDPAALARARRPLEAMRTEVTAGQFLDVVAQATSPLAAREDPAAVTERVQQVVEYKTARYTFIRPLHIGAAAAGANPEQLESLARFGSALGRGFQYRDDVLGVFGDPELTGKPAGDDLREGKLTVLVASAMRLADPQAATQLAGLIGDPQLSRTQIEQARRIITDSGALAATETEIADAYQRALEALEAAPITAEAKTALRNIADQAVHRSA